MPSEKTYLTHDTEHIHSKDYTDEIAFALAEMVYGRVKARTVAIYIGTWNAVEAEDANLSNVTIEGIVVRWVRKISTVTGLVAGNSVLMIKGPSCPLTILGKIVGDITLAAQ